MAVPFFLYKPFLTMRRYNIIVYINTDKNIVYSGISGNLDWSLDENGLLMISGVGDYGYEPGWLKYSKEIKLAVVNVKDVSCTRGMFESCSSLTSLDVSGFDTSNVTDMNGMFWGCDSLTKIIVPSKMLETNLPSIDGFHWEDLNGVTVTSTIPNLDASMTYTRVAN